MARGSSGNLGALPRLYEEEPDVFLPLPVLPLGEPGLEKLGGRNPVLWVVAMSFWELGD